MSMTQCATSIQVRNPQRRDFAAPPARRNLLRSFTLIELVVVMGIIAVLGILTTIGYRGIAKDAKLSSGRNTVAAVLENARGLAMRNNRVVAVVFRPRLDGKEQYIECVTMHWTGESARVAVGGPTNWQVVDRFAPMPGVATRTLPRGIKVAAPLYGASSDLEWMTPSHLPRIDQNSPFALSNEYPGGVLGVMYAPDGRTITRNSQTDSARMLLDWDDDAVHEWGGGVIAYGMPLNVTQFNNELFEQRHEHDECWLDVAPFLAVYDDDEARELYDPDRWVPSLVGGSANAENNRIGDYSEYITNNADRIHFNRYTGVAMK